MGDWKFPVFLFLLTYLLLVLIGSWLRYVQRRHYYRYNDITPGRGFRRCFGVVAGNSMVLIVAVFITVLEVVLIYF